MKIKQIKQLQLRGVKNSGLEILAIQKTSLTRERNHILIPVFLSLLSGFRGCLSWYQGKTYLLREKTWQLGM